jgi:ferritin-like metal-binding protein YciE
MSSRDTFIAWLNDAYATEQNQIQVLDAHIRDARDHPQLQQRLSEHQQQTRRHAEVMRSCIEQLGGSVSNIKSAIGTVSGFVTGRSTSLAADTLIKNAIADYTAEAFEIVSYQGLIAAADAIGQPRMVDTFEEIMREEEDMQMWLEEMLPTLIREHLNGSAGGVTQTRGVA